MSSVSFIFLQLFAVAMISCQASNEVATPVSVDSVPVLSFFQELGLDRTLLDAVAEAVLALAVFGAASAMLTAYRRRNPKSSRLHKAKVAKLTLQDPPPVAAKRVDRNSKVATLPFAKQRTTAITWGVQHRTTAINATPGAAVKGPKSETDALANAVRSGMAAQLPQLLDGALARLLRMNTSVSEEDVAAYLLCSALRACAANRCFGSGIAAYEHMAGRVGGGNAALFSVLLYCKVEAASFSKCKCVFDNLCKHGKPSGHDFVNMVRCCVGQEDAEGLQEILASLCGSAQFIDVFTFNRALAACGTSDILDSGDRNRGFWGRHSKELVDALVDSGVCVEGLDAVGYNTLMKYNARAGCFSRCFALRAEMIAKGIEASEMTFGILLEACVIANEIKCAKKVFDDLCSSGVKMNVVHCTTFIKSLLAAGELDEAAAVLGEMASSSSVKPDLITYSTVVRAYADAGDVRSALKILQDMMEYGVRPDEIIFNCVLTACSIFPLKSSQVMLTFETLIGLGMRPSTTSLSILLKGLVLTQAWATSLQVLKDAPTSMGLEPETRLFVQLAQACVKDRARTEVLEIFDAMLEAVSRRGERADPAIVSRLLRSCVLSGDLQGAKILREASLRAGVPVEAHIEKLIAQFDKKARLAR